MQTTVLLLLAGQASAMVSSGYRGFGFLGYGIPMYQPPCAHACRSALSGYMLSCSEMSTDEDMSGMDMKLRKRMDGMGSDGPSFTTSPHCYAADDEFLQSLAYCISHHCSELSVSTLESFWATAT